MQVFEPEREIEFSGGEVAAGDEAEKGILNFGGKFGEGITGVSARDGVDFVETKMVVEDVEARRRECRGLAGAVGESGIELGGDVFGVGMEDARGDGLQGGELGRAQVLRNVEGACVDKLLKAKVGWGLGEGPRGGEILVLGTDGHDTILLMKHGLRSCTYWTLERGGKVSFRDA